MDSILSIESTAEEILQRFKDENTTGFNFKAISEEVLQRVKEEGLIVEAMAGHITISKEILQSIRDEGLMVETMSKEILQRLRDELIRKLTVIVFCFFLFLVPFVSIGVAPCNIIPMIPRAFAIHRAA